MIDSEISGDLRKRLDSMEQTADGEYLCKVCFDSSFRGFEGHFEGNPIVPGVCLIELARVHAETVLGQTLRTGTISLCRFRSPILAGMTACCKLTVRKLDHAGFKLQAEIRADGNVACQVRMETKAV